MDEAWLKLLDSRISRKVGVQLGQAADSHLRRRTQVPQTQPPRLKHHRRSVTLAAAHDIGKITPGFLRKCPLSFFSKINGGQNCESNHALMSQAFLASLREMQDERKIPLAWGLAAGGHHGSYPTAKVSDNLEKRGGLPK